MRSPSLLACAFLSSQALAAIVIDDFSEGAVFLEAASNDPGNQELQEGLSPAHVLGGSRFLTVGSTKFASIEVATTAGELRFRSLDGYGYFDVTYGSEATP